MAETSDLDAPIAFSPVYQERVWGGRELESQFGRSLPAADVPYGESWEIVDRPEAQSIVRGGRYDGKTLGELWGGPDRTAIFGCAAADGDRFPILVKILDARERLSIQVHPPSSIAPSLGGEPKTEMWVVVDADPGAELFVGLRHGVDRARFEDGLRAGKTEEMVHSIPVKKGDFIFIPSGRLHAIGGGLVIFEIQQNSDTTYRVFDWNRVGLDGNPRELHIDASLQCIDFHDVEPGVGQAQGENLVTDPLFNVDRWTLGPGAGAREPAGHGTFAIFGVSDGTVECGGRPFSRGDFFVVPAARSAGTCGIQASPGASAELVRTTFGGDAG